MLDDLGHWVHAAAGRRALLIGDLILDRYIYGDAERISPEAPVPILRTLEKREAVGGSANVGACLAALGVRVDVCGVVGADLRGTILKDLLGELGADVAGVLTIEGRPTTTKTRLVGLAQHRHRQQLMRIDDEEISPLEPAEIDKLLAFVRSRVADTDVVCIEDYGKGLLSESALGAIIAEAKRYAKPVLVDPARLTDYSRYRGADVVTPNRQELSLVAGRTLESVDDVASVAVELVTALDLTAVVATVDREGAVLAQGQDRWQHFPTIPRSVYDNTGAGDAVLAMLAAALAGGADYASATRLANVAGGLEVERFGCVPISAEEILAELRLADRLDNGKLRRADELAAELTLRRDRGETVVFTNGCFDILHAGHVDLLKRCRREGTVLVVGVNSDASVRTQGKGDDRPINRFEHRAAVIAALECVDYVVAFDEPTPEVLIRKLRPHVLAKGADWSGRGVVGAEFVESIGGCVRLLPLIEGLSTTAMVERIRGGK